MSDEHRHKPTPLILLLAAAVILLIVGLWKNRINSGEFGQDSRLADGLVEQADDLLGDNPDTERLRPSGSKTINTRLGNLPSAAPKVEVVAPIPAETAYPATEDFVTSSTAETALGQLPGELIGWVSDTRNLPVPGAKVTLKFEDETLTEEQKLVRETVSETTGLFRFRDVPPAHWTIMAEKTGYAKDVHTGIVIRSNERSNPVDLSLGPEMVLKGVVKDNDREVPNAQVVAYRDLISVQGAGEVQAVTMQYGEDQTSAKGEFEIKQLPQGVMRVRVMARGYAPLDTEVTMAPELAPVALSLTAEALISGMVRNELAQPMENVTFELYPEKAKKKEQPIATTKSLSTGLWEFLQLPRNTNFRVIAKAEGFADWGPMEIPSGSLNNVVVMTTGGAIEGRVINFDDGKPVVGISILVLDEDPARKTSLLTSTNADGKFRVERIPPGSYHVSVYSERLTCEPRPGVKMDGKAVVGDVNFSVYPGLSIEGYVVDGDTGEWLGNAEVTVDSRVGPGYLANRNTKEKTDEVGSFQFTNLPQGVYTVRASREGYMPAGGLEESVRVELLRGKLGAPIEIKLFRAGYIEGSVVDAAGVGVTGAIVQLFHGSGTPARIPTEKFKATTRTGGYFLIEGIPIQNEVRLHASAFSPNAAKGRSEVMVLSRRLPMADCVIQLSQGQVVQVYTKSTRGDGLSDVNVSLSHDSFPGDPTPAAWAKKTGVDGSADFVNIPAGMVRISASKKGYLPASTSLSLRDDQPGGAELSLEPARIMAGRVVDDWGVPVAAGRVDARPEAGARGSGGAGIKPDGRFLIDTLGPGTFRADVEAVRATKTGDRRIRWAVPKVLPQGANIENQIAVPMSGVLSGKVLFGETENRPPRYTVSLAATYRDKANLARTFNVSHAFDTGQPFEFDNLPAGDYRVTVSAANFLPVSVGPFSLESPGVISVGTISLKPGGALQFKVVDARTGEPINAVLCTLRPNGPSTRTNGKGEANLNPVSPGIYTLTLSHDQYLATEQSLVRVSRSQTTNLDVLEMEPGAILHGEVTDGSGRKLPGVRIDARAAVGETLRTVYTDASGRYQLRGLIPGGHVVTFAATINKRPVSKTVEVLVSAEQETKQDMLLRADSRLVGSVTGPPGTDASRSIVTLYPLRSNTPLVNQPITPDKFQRNVFTVDNLVEGYYLVSVQAPRGASRAYWSGIAGVLESESTTNITAGNQTLRGRILTRTNGLPVKNQSLRLDMLSSPESGVNALRRWWQWTATTDANGNFTFADLPPGTFSLIANNEALEADILEIITLSWDNPVLEKDFTFNSHKPEQRPAIPAQRQQRVAAPRIFGAGGE